ARMPGAGGLDVGVGDCQYRTGRVRRLQIAETGAVIGGILDRVGGSGIGCEARLTRGRRAPPGEAAQVLPLALSHFEHEDGVAQAVRDVLKANRLPRYERSAQERYAQERRLE